MDKELELEVVKSAYFLEDRIANLERNDQKLRRNKPEEPLPPAEPKLETKDATPLPYPAVKVKSKYKWSYFVLFVGVIVFLAIIASFIAWATSINATTTMMPGDKTILTASNISLLLWILGFLTLPVGIPIYFNANYNDKRKKELLIKNSYEYLLQTCVL